MQEQQLLAGGQKAASMFASPASYQDPSALYQAQYPGGHAVTHNLHYTTVPPPVNVVDQPYTPQQTFPTPPLPHSSRSGSPPDAYSPDEYGQQDLADLLGSLKVNEAGTGGFPFSALRFAAPSKGLCCTDSGLAPYLNNKLKAQTTEEEPAVEDADEYKSLLPPLVSGPGLKIRIPQS